MKILGKTLYSEEEVIGEINNRLKQKALEPRLFSYLKDVRDIIPKPIRIKTKQGRSGAHSYYTEDTLEYLNEIMREYRHAGKSLKEIQGKFSTTIEEHIIKADIFRYKCEVYLKFKKAMEGPTRELSQAFGNVSVDIARTPIPEYLNEGLKATLTKLLKAMESNKSEEALDSLFEMFIFTYNQRLKYRMKDKVLAERGGGKK
ncbi:MAG: hypothetical protein WCS03_11725 [Bacteroidota bacterium]|nr:MAG: hypothetical protein D4R78_05250 [bacterium]